MYIIIQMQMTDKSTHYYLSDNCFSAEYAIIIEGTEIIRKFYNRNIDHKAKWSTCNYFVIAYF